LLRSAMSYTTSRCPVGISMSVASVDGVMKLALPRLHRIADFDRVHAEIAWRKKPFGQSFERGEFRLFGDADSSLALHVGVAANRTDIARQAIP
jgi:hypothetical protein